MAWTFKRWDSNPTADVLDLTDFTDNMLQFTYEVSRLGEANWNSGCLTAIQDAEQVADDIYGQLSSKHRGDQDPHPVGNGAAFAYSGKWEVIEETDATILTKGGPVLIYASFQTHTGQALATDTKVGAMFAIQVDGRIMYESLIGSGDLGNDVVEKPTGAKGQVYAAGDYGTGPAIKAVQYGLVTQAVAFLAPGEHTIALAARNPTSNDPKVSDQEVTQAEWFAWEMNA